MLNIFVKSRSRFFGIAGKKNILLFLLSVAQFSYSQCTFTYFSPVNCTCYGACNGSASVPISSITGGLPPFTFNWSTAPPQTLPTATNLCAGIYQCVITDSNGIPCLPTNPPPTITEPPQIIILITGSGGPCDTCTTLSATVTGGIPPYSNFLWNDGEITSSIHVCTGGVYTVTVSDNNGCSATTSAVATFAPPVSVTHVSTNATCATCCDGSYTTSVGGGTPPYAIGSPCGNVTNVCPGTYICCVSDANGCADCDTIVISYPTSISENFFDDRIKISPNPFSISSTLTINPKSLIRNPKLYIYDVTGREVKQFAIRNPKSEIQRGDLQSGIYFYKVMSDERILGAGKIIIE